MILNGLIEQWGNNISNSSGYYDLQFPISFSTTKYVLSGGVYFESSAVSIGIVKNTQTISSVRIGLESMSGYGNVSFYWQLLGC